VELNGFNDPDGTNWPACDYGQPGMLVEVPGGVSLYVEVEGQGPPLLAIHGGPGVDHRSLHPGLSVLAGNRRILYVDLRGHYMSPLPAEQPHLGLATDVADLAALIEALGLGPLDVFGHSYGGLVTLSLTAEHPQLVRRVVCCSAPIGANEEQIEARMEADPRNLQLTGDEQPEDLYLSCYYEKEPSEQVRRWALAVRDSYDSARNAAMLELREGSDEGDLDWAALLDRAQCATLVLHGAQDPIVDPELLRAALTGRDNFSAVQFEGCRHDPFHDQPQQFRDTVLGFLAL
jgi:proline iminopeptidase